jgi:hypothetical protein
MTNVIIWGYAYRGANLYMELKKSDKYHVIGFADNSVYKQGKFVNGVKIMSIDDVVTLNKKINMSVIIASSKWSVIGRMLEKYGVKIEGIYQNNIIMPYEVMTFDKLELDKEIFLYAGDICDKVHMENESLYGLSICKEDSKHILHDITIPYPLPDNCISSYQAEDVLEHISLDYIIPTIDEIYRILKPGALFRLCLPDYNSPLLREVSMTDAEGNIVYEATGGGTYGINGVENGGHVWFPNYKLVKHILDSTKFNKYNFICYHTEDGKLYMEDIDFSKGYINRVYKKNECEIISMVIDCYK